MTKIWNVLAVVIAIATGAIGTFTYLHWRYIWVDFRTYDSFARTAVADMNMGVSAKDLECRNFTYEHKWVWEYPHSTILYSFDYNATNQQVITESPAGITTTTPIYGIAINQDGSVFCTSTGSETLSPSWESRPPNGPLKGAFKDTHGRFMQ